MLPSPMRSVRVACAIVAAAAVAAGCGESSSSTAAETLPSEDAPASAAAEALPQHEGLALVEPPPLTDDLTIPATGLPEAQLVIDDGCVTALLENGAVVSLHFFDGYAGFDGTTLFHRPFGDPDSVPAEFEDGDLVGVTGFDASPTLAYIAEPQPGCPTEGTVVYSIRRR